MKKADRKHDLRVAWDLTTNFCRWPFVTEYKFHPTRRWRFDWADPKTMVAIEIDGITYFGRGIGRHQSAKGIEGDMEKGNSAIALGWVVLHYSPRMLTRDPVGVVRQIRDVLEMRE